MVSSMKERYGELKKYGNILLNYDDILLFYPDYFKTKIELEKKKFIPKAQIDKAFDRDYRNSILYKKLVDLAMDEKDIYKFMSHNKDIRYKIFKSIFDKLIQFSIELCQLIDYIGHYPTTFPVPREEEKNPKMEELLEKYDIIVRYYSGDIDEMQITSEDVVRIIEKLETNLCLIQAYEREASTNGWLFRREATDEKIEEYTETLIREMVEFPLSDYQKQQKSKREEGKHFLRLQYGNTII